MKQLEQNRKISEYKIICIKYCDKPFSNPMNLHDFLLEVKSEYAIWSKIDIKNCFEDGISSKLLVIINALEHILSNEISTNDIQSIYHFSNYMYSKFNKLPYYSAYSNSILSFDFTFFSKNYDEILKIRSGYVFCLKNYNYDALKKFFQLYSGTATLGYCFGQDRNKNDYKAGLLFVTLETKTFKNINKIEIVENQINDIKNDCSAIVDEISKIRSELLMFADDYVTSYNSWKTEKEQWFQQKENEITEIKLKYEQRMTDLENIYSEKLKLEEPVKFWDQKAKEKGVSFIMYACLTSVFSIIVLGLGYYLVELLYEISISVVSYSDVVPFSFVVIALISFLVYLLRMFIKLMLSSKHLQTEYQQKANFTYFYLSLLNNQSTGKQVTEAEKNLIYHNLFSNPDTGLIKGSQDNTDVLNYVAAVIAKDK